MSGMIRVLVADDHPLMRDGIVTALLKAADFAVVAEVSTAAEAVRAARLLTPHLALLDVAMPGNGLTAIAEVRAASPATKVVMLTVSEDDDDVLVALKAGASGYILKGVSASELAAALRSVHGGAMYVAPGLAGLLLKEMAAPAPPSPLQELSARELAVLELVSAGMSNAEIAMELSLAEKTVKHYVSSILTKLQVRSRVEAALVAHHIEPRTRLME